jgi:hypothetical protein
MIAAAVSLGTRASGFDTNENYISEEEIFVYGYLHLCLWAAFATANNIAVFWCILGLQLMKVCCCLVVNVSSETFNV